MSNNSIPVCPLMSAGNEIQIICVQERCAWYVQKIKACSMQIVGQNAMLSVKEKVEKHLK